MQENNTSAATVPKLTCDYVTILTMDKPTGKHYAIDAASGEVVKTPAANAANGWAVTHYVPDANAFAALIESISTSITSALVLGFIAGTESGEPYRVMSDADFKLFAETNKVKLDRFAARPIIVDDRKFATRTKRMFHASTWFGFDRDTVDGMPAELEPDASFDRWWEMMCDFLPVIAERDYVAINSASCRVEIDGVAVAHSNAHVYMQAEEANDTERFGKAGMVHSFDRGYGFMRPITSGSTGEVIGNRPWTLYDPTTFSRERMFFDGSPMISDDPRLHVSPSNITIHTGERQRVSTRLLQMPSKDEQRKIGLEFDVDNKGRVKIVNVADLTPDVEITYKDDITGYTGTMTMQEFVDGDADRVRCQAVFRPDSFSWAAYLSKEDGCHPFMYDVGTNINYKFTNVQSLFEDSCGEGVDDSPDEKCVESLPGSALVNRSTTSAPTPPPPPPTPPPPKSSVSSLTPTPPAPRPRFPVSAYDEFKRLATRSRDFTEFGTLHGVAPEFTETDMGNTQRFCTTFRSLLRFVPLLDAWFWWDGYLWNKCESNEEHAAAQEMVAVMTLEANQRQDTDSYRKWVKISGSVNSLGAVIRLASRSQDIIVRKDELEIPDYVFTVGNGYIDLRQVDDQGVGDDSACLIKGFMPPDRSIFSTKGSAVDYDGQAGCPEWEQALQDIFDYDQDLIDFFQIFAGYTMLGRPVHEVMAFFVGNGSNGKSTIIGVLEKVFGGYKATVDKSVLMSKRDGGGGQAATPALARLQGLRMAVITETREGDRLDESIVKSLSGSDTITARHLYGNVFDFDATFVSWIATNHAPDIRSVDEGTWRRILHFQFNRDFLAEKGRDGLDTGLKQRILDNELSGVLNWCLEGVTQYYAKGLVPPKSVVDSTDAYREDMDVIADWFASECEVGPDDKYYAANEDLWASYCRFAAANGDQLIRYGSTLSKKIISKGFKRIRHIPGYHSRRGFSGLRLRASPEVLLEKMSGGVD